MSEPESVQPSKSAPNDGAPPRPHIPTERLTLASLSLSLSPCFLSVPTNSIVPANQLIHLSTMIDTTSLVIQSIWAEQYAAKKTKLVSLRVFIQEVLRRSRTTYSTLQTALFYLFRVKNAIVTRLRERASRETEQRNSTSGQCNEDDLIGCGRRMFLAALMVASKYLQDKNYRNRAWAKISGLSVHEINATEIAFLKLIDYNLFVSKPTFDRWYTLLHSQVAGAAAKDDQQTPSACLASDMLFSGSTDPSVERLSPLPMSLSPPAARVPSPSQTSTSSSELEETDSESLKQAKDARVRQYLQSQKLQRAPDSGIALYMTTPKLSPEPRSTEHRPIARPRHLPAAPAQSSNNVVVAPYLPGVRPVVRTTSAAAFLPSPPSVDGGKRKHVELSMLDEGYSSYSYESAISAIQVPDVCSVVKKFRADDDSYLGEDAAVVEMVY
ncbi:cyclin-domain-containing protein [Endogone sp. FLAS-F59071]|nr:cyclin-domain-containing protein [Endogone sp. FLAS-F59071]|eukprot:RUS21349.1 cyclin-domain-containing protein [Endogone sp. FLAS-F59071]